MQFMHHELGKADLPIKNYAYGDEARAIHEFRYKEFMRALAAVGSFGKLAKRLETKASTIESWYYRKRGIPPYWIEDFRFISLRC